MSNRSDSRSNDAPLQRAPKHWALRALLVLGLIAASCSVPTFAVSDDAGTGVGPAVVPHCSNLVSDEGETGVDCGGTCPGCASGGSCLVNNDCAGNECIANICQDASCTDGVQSGGETDVDCGGGGCTPCTSGLRCAAARDCLSGSCLTGACAQPSCTDNIQNGDESDVDCGGACPTCLPGQKCKLPTDCAGGDCTTGTCSLTCLDGKGNCDGDPNNGCETNLKTDADHCGACETPCKLAHASAHCTGGACQVDTCTAPFADCDSDPKNGCETNTSTDPINCNGCGMSCPGLNGMPTCVASACQINCDAGFNDCDDDRSNGCETSVSVDTDNCGKCGNVCPSTGGTPNCKAGVCGITNCAAGLGDCDADGVICETKLASDVNNCGKCGKPCVVSHGTPACTNGVCGIASCDPGYADCTGGYADGCETNIASDPAHCGSCTNACSIANAAAKCVNKVCQVATCTLPWADCDGNGTDCETNTSTNTTNCGGCGTSGGLNCTGRFANATGKCVPTGPSLAGACQLDKCAANFADCNGNPDLDGCEANLKGDAKHCGTCATVCLTPNISNSNLCTAGLCVPTCNASFGDCDGNVNSGCEAVLASDPNNCGGCGTKCLQTNASNVCTTGKCNPTCTQTYFKSCDGDPINGCEVDDRTSNANCGGCGMACQTNAATPSNTCSGSTCTPTCAGTNKDCDSNPNNGCETQTAGDPANCGGCNVKCLTVNATSSTCGGGTCAPACSNGWAMCSNPAAGCLTSIDTAAHCGNCGTACSGGTPFCVSRLCAARLAIGVVNSGTNGSSSTAGASLTVAHALQTSLAANAYRLVLVGVTGAGNGAASLPASVTYNNVAMTAVNALNPANQVTAVIYYILGKDLPVNAGSYNVKVNSSGSNSFSLTANVVELTNVEQATSPIDHFGGQVNGSQCSSHMPSDAVTVTTAGEFIYSVASVYGTANDVSPNASGQTITEQNGALGTVAGYLAAASAGSHTITWQIATCNATAHDLVAIKATVTP